MGWDQVWDQGYRGFELGGQPETPAGEAQQPSQGTAFLGSVTRGSVDEIKGSSGQVVHDGQWEKLVLKIDSGAIDTCIPTHVAKAFPIKETMFSKLGINYQAANGTEIKNHGERMLKGFTEGWQTINLCTQVADVRTTLGSVSQMVKAGNRVVFSPSGNKIINEHTGLEIPIRDSNGSYEVDLWIPKAKGEINQTQVSKQVKVQNRYQALQDESAEEDAINMDFIRQGEC